MCWCRPLFAPYAASCGKTWCVMPPVMERVARQMLEDLRRPAAEPPVPALQPGPGKIDQRPVQVGGALRWTGSPLDAEQRADVDARSNRALLASCPAHNFETALDRPGARVRPRWRCSVCTGVVEAEAKFWYEAGRDHGALRGPSWAGRSDNGRSLDPSS
jgi:hypothetical protein